MAKEINIRKAGDLGGWALDENDCNHKYIIKRQNKQMAQNLGYM